MSEIRIVIADDEAPARKRLRELLGDIEQACVVGEAKNGQEALNLAEQTQADVVLLDIRMPGMDGIEAALHLQKLNPPPAIIFTTAYDAYAVQAFDMNALDYLLKPIRLERLQTAIDKAKKLNAAQLDALKPLQHKRSHFSVTERGRVLLVPLEEVIYLRAELKYITLRTHEREYLLDDSLTSIEQEFGEHFVRLHRNCLVAQRSIMGYERRQEPDGETHYVALLRELPEAIVVSRRQQHVLKELLKG
ncbi:MAG: DNA-binding response regulator [Betaproteobacteria bacterium HGW-Betaproteobacteria-1]|jgi:two-component system response regulator AlgR|nr:MAG: DNA-binding response regulator [Betaproteobacteria bacterium HGW-Betaproteobacteria-1]